MEKIVEIVCTMEQLETIKTALKMERERNAAECFARRKNPNETKTGKYLASAMEAVNNWKWRT